MRRISRVIVPCVAAVAAATTVRAEDPPLGAVEPTAEEQQIVYVLNKARHDPVAYGTRISLDLTGVAPRPPLAVNPLLFGSARYHAQDMLENHYFAHVNPTTGKGPNQLAADNGYDVFGAGLPHDWDGANNVESIASGENLIPTFADALTLLIRDDGEPGLGHRRHLLAIDDFFALHREIGAGKATSGTSYRYAIHTAYVNESDVFLTGVVIDDLDGDGRYDQGEGLGGVTIDAGGGRTTTSLREGGWSLRVPPGTYDVRCSGGGFRGTATAHVQVVDANREIDFGSGRAIGDIDFAGTAGPSLTLGVSQTTGLAPLAVDFAAGGGEGGIAYDWDLGDGAVATGPAVSHTYADPGVYVVRLRATDATGTGGRVATICVEGPDGAGPGTSSPSSDALTSKALKARVNFAAAGVGIVTFTGRFEMPAGWTRGLSDAAAVVAGAKLVAPFADKDGYKDPATGSFLRIKYKRPKSGAPLAAGVKATVTIRIKGDLASVLGDLGLRDATEKRVLTDVPVALLLGTSCRRGTAKVSVVSTMNVKSVGTLVLP